MLKKTIYLIVSGGLLLSGCSLDYEPLNGPSSGSFPASEEEAMAGLYAAYKGLANMTVKETPFPMRINDCISDIGTYRTGAGNQIKAMSSTLTADNTMCEKVYKTVYKIAGRVHLVLDNLDRLRASSPKIGSTRSKPNCSVSAPITTTWGASSTATSPSSTTSSIWTITPTIRVSRASR